MAQAQTGIAVREKIGKEKEAERGKAVLNWDEFFVLKPESGRYNEMRGFGVRKGRNPTQHKAAENHRAT